MTGGGVSAPTISNPQNFQPTGFNSFGLQGSFDKASNTFNINDQTIREGPLAKLRTNLFGELSAFGNLLNTVQPGFSQFRQAGLQQIENQRQQTTSNLAENLSQRRALGSSFAQSSLSGVQADFAQTSANFIAQSYLQELSASNQLTQEKFQATSQAYQATIQQYNLDGALAAQMAGQATSVLASIAETQAQLQLQSSEFNAQLQASEMAALGGAAGGLLGMFGGGGGGGMSDADVKENVLHVGTTVLDLPLYQFNYRGDDVRYEGVIAQDVLKVMPAAVYRSWSGYYHVDYEMLGIKMRRGLMPGLGDVVQSIVSAAQEFGLGARTLLGIASIESSLNPTLNQNNKRTQYKGLFQMGRDEWKKFGQGNIYNAKDNARAAAKMLASHGKEFEQKFGRAPSDKELYMIHQQGMGFFTGANIPYKHFSGNTPRGNKVTTNRDQFASMWGNILQQREARFDKTLGGQPGLAYNAAPTSSSDRAFAGAERGGMSAADAVAALAPQEKAYLAGGTSEMPAGVGTAAPTPAARLASGTAPAKAQTIQQVIDKNRNDPRFSQFADMESMIPDRNMPADKWAQKHGDLLNHPMVPAEARQIIQAAAKPQQITVKDEKAAPTAQQVSQPQPSAPQTQTPLPQPRPAAAPQAAPQRPSLGQQSALVPQQPATQSVQPPAAQSQPPADTAVDFARDTPGYNEEYGIHPPEPGPQGTAAAPSPQPAQPDTGSKVLDFLGGGPQQAGTSGSMPQATASSLQPAAPPLAQPQQSAAASSTPLAKSPGQSNYAPQVTQFAKPPQGFYGEPSLWEKLQGTQTTASQGFGGESPTQQGGTQTQPLATAAPAPAAPGTPAPGLSTMTGGGFPMQMPQPDSGSQPIGMAPPQPGMSAGTPLPPAPAPMPMPSMGGGGMGGGGMGAPDMGAGAMGGEGGGMGGGGMGGMGGGFAKALSGAASAMQKMIPKPNVTINPPISPGAGAPDFSQRILQFLQQGQQQFQPQQQDQAT